MTKNSWQKNEKKIIDRSSKVVRKRLNRLGYLQITMNGIFWVFFGTLPQFSSDKKMFFLIRQ